MTLARLNPQKVEAKVLNGKFEEMIIMTIFFLRKRVAKKNFPQLVSCYFGGAGPRGAKLPKVARGGAGGEIWPRVHL